MEKEILSNRYSFNIGVCMVSALSNDLCEKLGDCFKFMEIDESVFGKMKKVRGMPVNGKWVLGSVERRIE